MTSMHYAVVVTLALALYSVALLTSLVESIHRVQTLHNYIAGPLTVCLRPTWRCLFYSA